MTVKLYIGTADQNWFSVVMLNLELPVYTEFPCLKIFPLHNFQKWDCLCMLAHTFGIGLLLLMDCRTAPATPDLLIIEYFLQRDFGIPALWWDSP